jgi:hypothetical protein
LNIPVNFNIGKVPKLPNGKNILSGDIELYIYDGKKHREKGPAEIHRRTGYEAWYWHGRLHRDGGPALIDPKNKHIEFWKNGTFLRREKL